MTNEAIREDTKKAVTADPPAASPDYFGAPRKGHGVRRLNNVPLYVVSGVMVAAILGVSYTFFERQSRNARPAQPAVTAGTIADQARPPVRPGGGDFVAAAGEPPAATDGKASTEVKPQAGPAAPAQPNETELRQQRTLERIEEKRLAQLETALANETGVQAFNQQRTRTQDDPAIAPSAAPAAARPFDPALTVGRYPGAADGTGLGLPGADANRQAEKRAFLARTPEAEVYLKHTRQAAIAPALEVKAGTVIPGVLISGVNSDLPGQIIGQVREHVYDSATGRNLLIPAGSRLIGSYDSSVTLGQSRALVAWTRVIYPDGSSVSLNLMPGSDQSGYAGFTDVVDNHYARIFGSGLMLSLFSAGLQLSQPKSTGATYDAQQIMTAELGRQMGQLGMEMTRKNMDIQPTLEIRPGYRFNVMVTKDIILPPWQGHPLAQARQ